MALFSPLPTALSTLSLKPELHLVLPLKRNRSLFVARFLAGNGAGMVGSAAGGAVKVEGSKLKGPTLIGGTWDLKQFEKNGKTDWDAVIDADAWRRKWLENYPEGSSNEEPIVFDTSTIPWRACINWFHLPEAESERSEFNL